MTNSSGLFNTPLSLVLLLIGQVVLVASALASCDEVNQPKLIHTFGLTPSTPLENRVNALTADLIDSYKQNGDGTVTFKMKSFLKTSGRPNHIYIASYGSNDVPQNLNDETQFCSKSEITGFSWFTFTPTCDFNDKIARVGIFVDDHVTSTTPSNNVLPDQCVEDSAVDFEYPKFGFYLELPCEMPCEEEEAVDTVADGEVVENDETTTNDSSSTVETSPGTGETEQSDNTENNNDGAPSDTTEQSAPAETGATTTNGGGGDADVDNTNTQDDGTAAGEQGEEGSPSSSNGVKGGDNSDAAESASGGDTLSARANKWSGVASLVVSALLYVCL